MNAEVQCKAGWQATRVADLRHGLLIVKRDVGDGVSGLAGGALRNEQQMLERLRGVAGCPTLVWFDAARRELAIEDFTGAPLSQSGLLGHLGLEDFLALCEALARTLAAIHGRGIIHRDINPDNILVRGDDLTPLIANFGLATTFTEERPGFDHPSRLHGNPAYLSPEQTGRMNRPVDYRADLYSLGATFYALATGRSLPERGEPGPRSRATAASRCRKTACRSGSGISRWACVRRVVCMAAARNWRH